MIIVVVTPRDYILFYSLSTFIITIVYCYSLLTLFIVACYCYLHIYYGFYFLYDLLLSLVVIILIVPIFY